MGIRRCKDCLAENPEPGSAKLNRPIVPDSGGRCATHWRAEKKRRKEAAHERRVQSTYGLPPGTYGILYSFQGGTCAGCRRARGISKKLAVDHDHSTGRVRGLLCSTCNRLLGHFRDDPETFLRLAAYLKSPPAAQLGLVAVHKENRGD